MSSIRLEKPAKSLAIETEYLGMPLSKKHSLDSFVNPDLPINFHPKDSNEIPKEELKSEDKSSGCLSDSSNSEDDNTIEQRQSFGGQGSFENTIKKVNTGMVLENIQKEIISKKDSIKDLIGVTNDENKKKKRHLDRISDARARAQAIRNFGKTKKDSKPQKTVHSPRFKNIKSLTCTEADLMAMKTDLPERLYAFDMKNKLKIEELRTEIIEQEMTEVKSKPDIDKNSVQICKKNSHIPIHLRYSWVKEDKERKLKNLIDEKERKEIEEISQMNISTQIKDARDAEEYYDYMMKWQQYRDLNILECRKQKLEKSAEAFSFHPKINKSSSNMKRDQDIVERLLTTEQKKKEKMEQLHQLHTPGFTPRINENSKKLAGNRTMKINEVNYNESMDFLVSRLKKWA